MRITTMTTILAVAMAVPAYAEAPEQTIAVYVRNNADVPPRIVYPAETLASRIFAGIGIRIEWHTGKPPAVAGNRPIEITLDTQTPADLRRGALAYALPMEGVHIHVFYDRVQAMSESKLTVVLAHVLVHEITHILQGVSRHSRDGIMKARWTASDIANMIWKPLAFTPEDRNFIRRGIAGRERGEVVAPGFETGAAVER